MKITIWSYVKHWLRFRCGSKVVTTNGQVLVHYRCSACAKQGERDPDPGWFR